MWFRWIRIRIRIRIRNTDFYHSRFNDNFLSLSALRHPGTLPRQDHSSGLRPHEEQEGPVLQACVGDSQRQGPEPHGTSSQPQQDCNGLRGKQITSPSRL